MRANAIGPEANTLLFRLQLWESDPDISESHRAEIAALVTQARAIIVAGSYVALSIMAILLPAMAVTPALRGELCYSGLAILIAWIISTRGGPDERPAWLDSHKRPCCTNGARARECDRGTEGCK